jgi:VCBS repeat-containing protein
LQNWTITAGNTDGIFAIDVATGAISVTDNTNLNFEATSSYTLTVTVADGVNTSTPQTVTINITNVNETPAAVADAYVTNEDTPLAIVAGGVLVNDSDVDGDALSAVLVSGPANGSLTLNADGSFTYTPDADWNGSDSFTYRAADSGAPGLTSNVVTVSITVDAVNDAPVASSNNYTVDADAALTVPAAGVLANDSDVDGDALAAAIVTGPANGTLAFSTDGSFTYTPNAGFSGSDGFTYVVSDGTTTSSIAAVTVEVKAVLIGPPILPPDPGFDDEPPGLDDPLVPDPIGNGDSGDGSQRGDTSPGEKGRRTNRRNADGEFDDGSTDTAIGVRMGPLSDESDRPGQGREWLHSLKRVSQQAARAAARLHSPNDLMKDLSFAVNTDLLWEKLDSLHEKFASEKIDLYTVGTATALTTAVSAGYVWWTLRGGYLIASALSSIPAWRLIDPLPILQGFGAFKETNEEKQRRHEEEESLASLVTESQRVKKEPSSN